MSIELDLVVLCILLLLGLSAFFNASETSLTAASRARMHALEEEGNIKAALVNKLLTSPERMIGTVLLANTLVDVAAAALATTLGLAVFGPAGVIYATGLVTLAIVVFSAVLPKTYAMAFADRTALMVAPPMRIMITVLKPATVAIEWLVNGILKLTPIRKDAQAREAAAHEELRGTIGLQTKEGAVEKLEANMLGGVLDLNELNVADIMVHRTKMEMVNAQDPAPKIISDILKSQYTRVPMWKEEPENIVGVLNTKDLLAAISAVNWKIDALDVASLVKPPWFVPDTTSLKDQLEAFLKRKAQLALVVDEYGEVQGLITLEDILEEIVGQIGDEHDGAEQAIRAQADGAVVVDGAVPIRDLNRAMDWSLPDEEATTIAGLVIHETQTIPEPGQAFTFYGYRFEIIRKARNKITLIRLRPVSAATLSPKLSGDEIDSRTSG